MKTITCEDLSVRTTARIRVFLNSKDVTQICYGFATDGESAILVKGATVRENGKADWSNAEIVNREVVYETLFGDVVITVVNDGDGAARRELERLGATVK